MKPPFEATARVHDGHQVEETPSHGYVGDVGGPHLVDPVDLQPPEQVRIDLMPWVWLAGVGTPVDGLQAYQLHQPADPLAVDLVSVISAPGSHPSGAVEIFVFREMEKEITELVKELQQGRFP